jgi:hypothetical protein
LSSEDATNVAALLVVPRTLARRWLPQGRSWPHWLRNKRVAVLLLAGFLWAYEELALWERPRWTAWIALAYFAAAFAIDGLFSAASERASQALKVLAPWAALLVLLCAVGIGIVLQPMQMRGTLSAAG